MRKFCFLFFLSVFLLSGAVYSQNYKLPFNIHKFLPTGKLPDTAACIKYLNTLPVLKTTNKVKEMVSQGVYEGFGQRYDSLAGSYLDGIAFFSRVNPGYKDSVKARIRAYSVNPINGTNLILGTTYAIITADTALPLRKIAFFDSGIYIQDKVIITVEASSLSSDNFFIERNSTPDGFQQNLSLVKQNGKWWQNLISNLGPEYDFDFLILPVAKKIHSGYKYTLDSTNALLTQNLCRGDTASFKWDFGDGKSSVSTAPAHTYTYNCIFSLKLTTYNNDKTCADSTQKSVLISHLPCTGKAGFTYQTDSVNRKIIFQNTSASLCPFKSVWYINDTSFSDSVSPVLNFPKLNKFQIRLDINTIDGICTDSFSDTIMLSTPNSSVKEDNKKKVLITVNPSVFNESFELISETGMRILIYNSTGQIMGFKVLLKGKKEKVNTSDWKAGIYLLAGEDGIYYKKIMKIQN